MSPRRVAALVLLALAVAVPAGLAPAALAHCPSPSGGILGLVRTCEHNAALEVVLGASNAQSRDSAVFVLVKDKAFHPPVVSVKSGGTVVFVYADADQSELHDPRNSGRCANVVDPVADPEGCLPSVLNGPCFSQGKDDGVPMQALGQSYPLTLAYTAPSGPVTKSRGFLSGSAVGDLTGAQPFTPCPTTSAYYAPTQAVLPYHCSQHGTPTTGTMRGTIVVQA